MYGKTIQTMRNELAEKKRLLRAIQSRGKRSKTEAEQDAQKVSELMVEIGETQTAIDVRIECEGDDHETIL